MKLEQQESIKSNNELTAEKIAQKEQVDFEKQLKLIIDNDKIYDYDSIPWPPGMMGELSQVAYKHQKLRYKPLAIFTAFAAIAGIVGKRYNISGTGLNLYYTILMESGSGKDQIKKFINRLYKEIGAEVHLGPARFTSGKSVINELITRQCLVSIQTEAGILLRSKAGDQDGITRTMLSAYTASGQHECLHAEAYSDSKNSLPQVDSVALTVVNEATPATLLKELQKRDSAATGELPRQFIHRMDGDVPYESFDDEFVLSESLRARLLELVDDCKPGSTLNAVKNINRDEKIQEFSRYCTDKRNEYRSTYPLRASMYTRAAVKYMKVAGLICVLDGVDDISDDTHEFCATYHQYEIDGLDSLFKGHDVSNPIAPAELEVCICIKKILSNHYKEARNQVSKVMRKDGIFPRSMLARVLKNNDIVKDLDTTIGNRTVKGVDRIMKMMEENGELVKLDPESKRMYNFKKTTVVYKVSSDFIDKMHDF